MLFLPFDNFTITTNLNAEQSIQKLLAAIEPPSTPYEGKISGYHFKINKISNSRNSFLSFPPIIEGKICPDIIGCKIKLQMKLHIAMMIFMLFWMVNFLLVAFELLLEMLTDNKIHPFLLAFMGVGFLGYLLGMIGFNFEAINAKNFLDKVLQSGSA